MRQMPELQLPIYTIQLAIKKLAGMEEHHTEGSIEELFGEFKLIETENNWHQQNIEREGTSKVLSSRTF